MASYSVEDIESILEESLTRTSKRTKAEIKPEPIPEPVVKVVEVETTEWEDTPWDGVEVRTVASQEVFGDQVPNVPLKQYRGFTPSVCRLEVPTVPAVYHPNVEALSGLILSSTTGLKPILYGHTGTGKTSLYEYFAAMLGRPFTRVVFDATTDDQKLFGSLEVRSVEGASETYFNKSDLSYSMDFPTVVCMDEFSRANAEQTMLVNPVLDRRQITVTSHDDEKSSTIIAHEDWFVGGTDNTNGTGDDMDLYNSSNVLDEAIRNRFDIWAVVPYSPEKVERDIIKELSPDMDEDTVKKLAHFSALCHKGYGDRKLRTAFSVRNLIAICALWERGIKVQDGIGMNFSKRVAESEGADIAEMVRSIWG